MCFEAPPRIQRATRKSQLLAQVAQLKALSPNLGSLDPKIECVARLDVSVTHGTLRVAACASHAAYKRFPMALSLPFTENEARSDDDSAAAL